MNGFSAEELSPPFPGAVTAAHAGHRDCTEAGCPIDYRVKITNTSDRDVFVQSCSAAELNPPLSLPIVDAGAGFFIGAGTTKSTHVHSVYVGLEKRSARSLVGQQLNCNGLDWHGHPPP